MGQHIAIVLLITRAQSLAVNAYADYLMRQDIKDLTLTLIHVNRDMYSRFCACKQWMYDEIARLHSAGPRGLRFGLRFHLHPNFV